MSREHRLLIVGAILLAIGAMVIVITVAQGGVSMWQATHECSRPYDDHCQTQLDAARWWFLAGGIGLVIGVAGIAALAASLLPRTTEAN